MVAQALILTKNYLESMQIPDVFSTCDFKLLDHKTEKENNLHLDGHAIINLEILEV